MHGVKKRRTFNRTKFEEGLLTEYNNHRPDHLRGTEKIFFNSLPDHNEEIKSTGSTIVAILGYIISDFRKRPR